MTPFNIAAVFLAPIGVIALGRAIIGMFWNGRRDEWTGRCLFVVAVCIVILYLLGLR